jgi:hypothetical protein
MHMDSKGRAVPSIKSTGSALLAIAFITFAKGCLSTTINARLFLALVGLL